MMKQENKRKNKDCDTPPLSLEPIAEVLKEGKVAQDVNKETQEMSKDPIAETHSERKMLGPNGQPKNQHIIKTV